MNGGLSQCFPLAKASSLPCFTAIPHRILARWANAAGPSARSPYNWGFTGA